MPDLKIENFIESQYREFFNGVQINNEYAALYEQIKHPKLRTILATAHHELVSLLELMNTRLPTYEESSHYWADPSRDLLKVISIIDSLHTNLQGSVHAFKIDDYYDPIRVTKVVNKVNNSNLDPSEFSFLNLESNRIEIRAKKNSTKYFGTSIINYKINTHRAHIAILLAFVALLFFSLIVLPCISLSINSYLML